MKQSIFQKVYRLLLGHPVARWFVVLGAIAYLLSPVDIAPDLFPIVGWIDDGVLAALVATGLTEILLERRRNLKAQKAASATAESGTPTAETSVTTIDVPTDT